MTWRSRHFGGTAARGSGDEASWRLRAFHGPRCRCRLCDALPSAPERATPSAALIDIRAEDQRERDAAERRERDTAAQIVETYRRREAERREQARRDAGAAIAELIAVHGRDRALAFVRRHEPHYRWPDDEGGE